MLNPDKFTLKEILTRASNIAVIGASDNPANASSHVVPFLASKGFNVYPVNPKEATVAGMKVYPSLDAVIESGVKIDIVDVFRRAEAASDLVEDASRLSIPVVWLQQGVMSADAMLVAEQKGITLISDLCIAQTVMFLNVHSAGGYDVLEALFDDYTGGARSYAMSAKSYTEDEIIHTLKDAYDNKLSKNQRSELKVLLGLIVTREIDLSEVFNKMLLPFEIKDTVAFIKKLRPVIQPARPYSP